MLCGTSKIIEFDWLYFANVIYGISILGFPENRFPGKFAVEII